MKFAEATKFHRKSGGAQWRDLRLILGGINSEGRAALTFVIPSEAEGSAVP